MKTTVFYSWQSDTPPHIGRELIRHCLEQAISRLTEDTTLIVRPELDHDTQGVPGTPAVVATVLQKIDTCSIFVADVTPTFSRRNQGAPRAAPNPNVLVELGYALKRLGRERLLLLLNLEYGAPETLPFDLRGDRVIGFYPDDPDSLVVELQSALHLVMTKAGPPTDLLPPVEITLKRVGPRIDDTRYRYQLRVRVRNSGEEIISGWAIEVVFPRAISEHPIVRSDNYGMVVRRRTESKDGEPLFPGDEKQLIEIEYLMDTALYKQGDDLLEQDLVISFFIGNRRVARAVRKVRDLHKF